MTLLRDRADIAIEFELVKAAFQAVDRVLTIGARICATFATVFFWTRDPGGTNSDLRKPGWVIEAFVTVPLICPAICSAALAVSVLPDFTFTDTDWLM